MEPNFSNEPVQNTPAKPGGGNERLMAVGSLALGVINLCTWFLPICGIPLAIFGIVLGIFGMRDQSQRTLAIIGIVLCVIGLILGCGNAAYGAYIAYTQGLGSFSP